MSDKKTIHKKDSHLWKLKHLGINIEKSYFSIFVDENDQKYIEGLINRIPQKENLVVVSPGSKSLIKRWNKEGFVELCDRLIEKFHVAVVMIGDDNDKKLVSEIEKAMKNKAYNLTGKTSITQLAHLLRKSKLLITNDSAPLHIGSAVGTRVLAIFGPTDPQKYGPQSKYSSVVRKELSCSPCEMAQCRFNHECMKSISADEIFETVRDMLKE